MTDFAITRRQLLGSASVATFSAVGSAASGAVAGIEAPRLPCKILISGLDKVYLDQIRAISPDIQIIEPRNDAERKAALPEVQVLFGSFTGEEVAAAKNLRWIQWGAAGVENLLFPELVKSDITLTNAKGCYGPEIAEHTFGLLFSLTRNINSHIRMMKDHNWKTLNRPIELRGLTMGVVGLGGIGREVARRAKAMDMKVIAVDIEPIYPEQVPMVDKIDIWQIGFRDLLKNSDVIVCCVPSTPKSRGMFGESEFALMKPSAYFINVSRGKLVQTSALLATLKNNKLAGAGLDVTDPEPLPANHPLWDIPNLIITPHIAGQSQLAYTRTSAVFVENVKRFVQGLPLVNIVDKVKGY